MRSNNLLWLAKMLCAVHSCSFAGQVLAVDLTPSIMVWYEGAYNIEKHQSSKSIVGVKPEFEWEFESGNQVILKTQFYADIDGTIEVGDPYAGEPNSPGDKISLDDSDNFLFELRELYYQTSLFGNLLAVGKQQIAWGQADGVTVLDIVNPLRYKEFILDDLEDSRIPLWSLNYQLQFDEFDLQLVWLLDQTYSDFPNADSEFYITSARFRPRYEEFPSSTEFVVLPLDKPSDVLSDSDFGFELSKVIFGWDMSLNYLYHYADNPVFPRFFDDLSGSPVVTVAETYRRTHTLGSNMTTSVGEFVIRTEWAYHSDRYVTDYNAADADGLLDTDELSYVIGLDYYGLDSSLLSAQVYQSRFGDYTNTLSREKVDTIYTLLYRADFLNETLSAEVQYLYGSNVDDSLIRFSTQYKINDFYTVVGGIDVFSGDENGLFGQFKKSDRVSLGITARF